MLPQIIPVVFYTGKDKWNAPLKIEEIQEKVIKGKKLYNFEYILIDINNYTKEELLKRRNIISYMILLEKSRDKKESIKMLEKIFENCKNKQEIEEAKVLLNTALIPILGEEVSNNLINKYRNNM